MKLQLFLDNQEIDLNGTEVFPVNKTYENLENPMDIVSEYSKSINIPISINNNKILANSYRLDREIVYNPEVVTNLGLYFDPNKRIPMRLVYNNDVILDGYAKYVSSTVSTKDKYYTLTLFGVLGDIFLKLKKVVVSKDRLTTDQLEEEDGGLKYVLNDYRLGTGGEETKFDMFFVDECWNYVKDYDIGPLDPSLKYYPRGVKYIYGAAPTYGGYYSDFDSTRVQISKTESSPISECLRSQWKSRYFANNNITSPNSTQKENAETFVDNLDPDEVVGSGMKNYQMKDYRAYKQRPFIYFNKLLYMFQNKISEISDYKLVLDENWFNISNPYWARLCYMFDFLQQEGQTEVISKPCFDAKETSLKSLTGENSKVTVEHQIQTAVYSSTTDNALVVQPFTIGLDLKLDKNITSNDRRIYPVHTTSWEITIRCGNDTHIFYASTLPFKNIDGSSWPYSTYPTENNFLTITEGVRMNDPFGYKYNPYKDEWCAYINIPQLTFTGDFGGLMGDFWGKIVPLTINIKTANKYAKGSYIGFKSYGESVFQVDTHAWPQGGTRNFINITSGTITNYRGTYNVSVSGGECQQYWNDAVIGLHTFYKKDEPLFDVILQYTKMFGLKWDVDYINKEIRLARRETLFKDYTIENWDDKLDKSQQVVIEPVVFPNKYIKFCYGESDGYRYKTYREKYGSGYGDKIVSTLYDFNSDDKPIIQDVAPTIASNRSFVSYEQWLNWNCLSSITPMRDITAKIECADEDDESSIDVGCWCLRTLNREGADELYYITNDSDLMIADGKSYYYDYRALENGLIDSSLYLPRYNLPLFSPVWKNTADGLPDYNKSYSCLFNTPQVDYTTDRMFENAKGNTIYEVCWEKFINERYNSQNKKMTAFFNLTIPDYNRFKFNKFVNVDNQLFMVNKIVDFEPTKNNSTKCELIQISDISAYTTPRDVFKEIEIETNANLIDGVYTLQTKNNTGTLYLHIRSFPIGEVRIINTKNGYAAIEDIEGDNENYRSYYISYELPQTNSYSFVIEITTGDKVYRYPCLIEKEGEMKDVVTVGYTQSFKVNSPIDIAALDPILGGMEGVKIHQIGNVEGAVYTNMIGSADLPLLADLPVAVVAESPDPRMGVLDVTVSRTASSSTMALLFGYVDGSLPLFLTRSYTVRGVVKDADGKPIPNAKVEQGVDDSYDGLITTTTNENGEFTLNVIIGFNNRLRCTYDGMVRDFGIPKYYEGTFEPAFGLIMQ